MLRYLFAGLWALCLAFFAFGSSAYAADKYVFILKWIGNPYWQAIKQGLENGGREAKISVTTAIGLQCFREAQSRHADENP
jgi:ABC-type sugar transport system substrate-binding protein